MVTLENTFHKTIVGTKIGMLQSSSPTIYSDEESEIQGQSPSREKGQLFHLTVTAVFLTLLHLESFLQDFFSTDEISQTSTCLFTPISYIFTFDQM